LPEIPALPSGLEAARLLAGKVAGNLVSLLLAATNGPRALWIAALALWLIVGRGPRPLVAAGWAMLAAMALGLASAAASIPWLRFLFPTRIPLEAAGTLALWGLLAAAPETLLSRGGRRALSVLVAVLALGWGAWQTARGNEEASVVSRQRGLPSLWGLRFFGRKLEEELAPDEAVMSNLGAPLAWYAKRPVIHLALTPADVEACRQRYEFRHVLLVFRQAERAWPGWNEIVERPEDATKLPEWNVRRMRKWRTLDGFLVIWLELGPTGVLRAGGRTPYPTQVTQLATNRTPARSSSAP
jgi:hypothetical protein